MQAIDPEVIDLIRAQLDRIRATPRRRLSEKMLLAALSGVPWVGDFINAALSFKLDGRHVRTDELQRHWLEEHGRKIADLERDLSGVAARIENMGAEVDQRIQSEPYLALVRRAFRVWDRADTEAKRVYVGNLVSRAATSRSCADDVVRLFVDWLDSYHESHFAIIDRVHRQPGSTRLAIWKAIYGEPTRDDSPEADWFRLLIRDLSTGGVIRQQRQTTESGQYLRRRQPARRRAAAPPVPTLESAFEDSQPYCLTPLGEQFVSYTLAAPTPATATATATAKRAP